jgi:hypothetical protein
VIRSDRREVDVPDVDVERPLYEQSTKDLLRRLGRASKELLRDEAELARAELLADLRQEIAAAKVLGVGIVCGILALDLVLVALALALSQRFTTVPPWAWALLVAGVTACVGAIAFSVGWSKRVKKPLERTQASLQQDVQWARERFS